MILPTSFEAMTGRTAFDGPLAEVFLGRRVNARFVHSHQYHLIIILSLVDRVTLRASGLWPGTWKGAGGTATLA